MPFIEGVGDEVIQFFGVVGLVFCAVLAWWSTNITDFPHIRTVLIVERRSQNVTAPQPNLTSQSSDRTQSSQPGGGTICGPMDQQNTLAVNDNSDNKSSEAVSNDVDDDSESAEPANSNLVSGTGPTKSLRNGDRNSQGDGHVESNENVNESSSNETESDNIRIRLKYLNDDQKLVEGRLQELLGDFKRRHFRMELSAQRLVRLIFNGQVLQRDEETLAGCGLYDNCVVHCLVGQAGQQTAARTSATRLNTPPPDWNLGGLLYVLLSLALVIAWLCWYNYTSLFTLTTTTALVGLTGMFAVSLVGLYMHDPETQTTTN